MKFLSTWWPALLVLAMFGAFYVHGKIQERKGRLDVEKDVKIEKVESENTVLKETITIRKRQNEIRNNRPNNDALINSLQDGSF